jgi:hypothetical protein
MGRIFYEQTMPRLVEEVAKLNMNLERVAKAIESQSNARGETPGIDPCRS